MSNYLSEIENEYSRIRGRSSMLTPKDWALAQKWEDSGIPLHIVISAMADVQKKFTAEKRPDKINSLSYFTQAVEKRFAEWQSSQVGKQPETILRKTDFTEETEMTDTAVAQSISDENTEILEQIADSLTPDYFERYNIELPEPLESAVKILRGELRALVDEAKQKQLSSSEIEDSLIKLRNEFETSLIVSVAEPERTDLIKRARDAYTGYNFTDEVQSKMLIRELYKKFGLPELTLFAF